MPAVRSVAIGAASGKRKLEDRIASGTNGPAEWEAVFFHYCDHCCLSSHKPPVRTILDRDVS